MGLPHSGQIGIGPSAAMCLALHLRRAAPFWYRPEPALLLMFPSCVFGGLGEILIRGPVVVFAGRRAVSAWPAGPLRYASRGMRGWLRSNDLRFWRPPLYVWCAPSGICGVRRAASISRRHACRGNRNRLCINTNNRSRGSLEVVRILRLSRSSRACRPRLGRAAGLESSRHRVSAGEAAMRLRRLLSRIGMTHFARDAPAGYGADAELPASPRHPQAR